MANGVLNLTDATFDEALKDATPILVDFWAEWCGPCRMIAPILEELATEYAGKVRIAKVNVDENADVARRFKVRSIPNLLLFKGGTQIGQIVGAQPKGDLKAKIDNYLG